jgi:hypothetical protein
MWKDNENRDVPQGKQRNINTQDARSNDPSLVASIGYIPQQVRNQHLHMASRTNGDSLSHRSLINLSSFLVNQHLYRLSTPGSSNYPDGSQVATTDTNFPTLRASYSLPSSGPTFSSTLFPGLQGSLIQRSNIASLALTDPFQQQLLPTNVPSIGTLGSQQEQLIRWLLAASSTSAAPSIAASPRRAATSAITNAAMLHTRTAATPPTTTSSTVPLLETSHSTATLYMDGDEEHLTAYQCLLRQQLEVFEAGPDDMRGSSQGRNTPILLGQVGLQCRHCASLPNAAKTKAAVYYSQTIDGIYQIAQNMSKVHLCENCYRIPPDIHRRLLVLKNNCRRASGGKEYWAQGIRAIGVYEDGRVLRMKKKPDE